MARYKRGRKTGAEALRSGAAGVQAAQNAAAADRARGSQMLGQMADRTQGAVRDVQKQQNFERQQGEAERAQGESERMQQEKINLGAAQSGMVPDERMQQLQSEMDAAGQRRQEQGDKPLELTGAGAARNFRPSDEAADLAGKKLEIEQFRAETARIQAMGYYQQTAAQYRKAKVTGSTETMDKLLPKLEAPWKKSSKLTEKAIKGELSDGEAFKLKQELGGIPDPAVQQEIASGEIGPRTIQALKAQESTQLLQFIRDSGGQLPKDIGRVSFDSPAMRDFQAHAQNFSAQIKSTGLGEMLPFKSPEERNEFLNALAARAVLSGIPAPVEMAGDLEQNAAAPAVGAEPTQANQPVEVPNVESRSTDPGAEAHGGPGPGYGGRPLTPQSDSKSWSSFLGQDSPIGGG